MIVERIHPAANGNALPAIVPTGPDWKPIELFVTELEERWSWRAVERELEDFVRAEWRNSQ